MSRREGAADDHHGEIDTSAPFRSVQEAVLLFGERILAGQVYANKLKELNDDSRLGSMTIELEETKQSLLKAREESIEMASCLSSLQEELQRTKRELQQLKQRESGKKVKELEIYHSKEEEEFQVKTATPIQEEKVVEEFQKRRYVTFANPPSLAQVIVPPSEHAVLQRHPSLRKTKKKPLLPLIKGFFRKRSSSGVGPAVDA